MNSQEKAKELISRYSNLVDTWDCYHDSPRNETYILKDSKECALIVVNEILNYHNSLFELGLKNVHQVANTPIEIYNDVMNPQKKYWEDVKKEIENL